MPSAPQKDFTSAPHWARFRQHVVSRLAELPAIGQELERLSTLAENHIGHGRCVATLRSCALRRFLFLHNLLGARRIDYGFGVVVHERDFGVAAVERPRSAEGG